MTNKNRFFVLLLACMTVGFAWAQDNLKAGTYYIQNVATGQYLTSGANYAYQGVLGAHGVDIRVTGSGTSFLLTTNLSESGRVLKATDGFMDGTSGTESKWTIEPKDDGTFTMYSTSKSAYYGYNASSTYPYVVQFVSTDDGSATRWRFLTKAALTETLDAATADAPVDATFLIKAPDFLRGDQRVYTDHCWGEDLTALGGNKDAGCTLQNPYNGEQAGKTVWTVQQTLKNIPNGVYRLSVQGFCRYGSTTTGSPEAYLNGTEERLYHLFAGSKAKDLVSVYTEAQTSQSTGFNRQTAAGYVPDNQAQAAVCFSDGHYVNTLDGIVVTGGTLTIGVRKDAKAVQNDWACFDNFTLMYLGNDLAAVKAAALEEWEAYNAKTVEGGDRSTYDAALAEAKGQIESAGDISAVGAALKTLQPAYEVYQSSPEVTGSPLDLTSMMVNADYKAGSLGWKMTSDYPGNFGFDTGYDPVVLEAYAGWQNFDLKSYSAQQEKAIRLAAGKYRLTVPALYRYGGDYNSDVSKKNIKPAYIFANGKRQQVMHLSDVEMSSYPDNKSTASAAFANGYYKNRLVFELTEPTDVTIGIKGTHSALLCWLIAGPMTLEKVMENQQLEAYLVEWEKLQEVANQATDHSSFDEAVEAGKAATTDEELAEADATIREAFRSLLKTGTAVNGQFDLTILIDNPSAGNTQEIFSQSSGTVTNTIAGMPAGTYTMKVQALYRSTASEAASIAYEKGTDVVAGSLFVGDATAPVKNINDDGRYIPVRRSEDVPGAYQRSIPNSLGSATDAFGQGLYWNTLTATVGSDGDVSFGLKVEGGKSENWLPYNNFRLYYGTGRPTVQLSVSEPYAISEDTRADVTTDIVLRAGQYNKVCLPFDMTASQVTATFTGAYTLGGVGSDGTGQLVPAATMKAGECYFVTVGSQKSLAVNDVLLRAVKPDSIPVIWSGAATVGSYDGYTFAIKKDRGGAVTTFAPIDFNNVSFTTNLENWQARRFVNDNNYTESSGSVVSQYNQAPPSRRDQPHSVWIPVPANNAAVTVTVAGGSLSSDLVIQFPAGTTLCEVPNLVPQQTYTYTATAGGSVVSQGQFTTEGRLRMIKATSGSNIRDMGGWKTIDGLRTRYGLIYRGGEMNGRHPINADDVQVLRALDIRGEVDLREDVDFDGNLLNTQSALGADIAYTYENLSMWNDDALQMVTDKWKDAFMLTLNTLREGHSVYFHCIWGADRTGCYAMLLGGLMGLTVDQLYKDYELTTFSHAGLRSKDGLDSKFAYIKSLPGNTLQEKFYNYWHVGVGIAKDDLLEFITRMVDGHSKILDAELPEYTYTPVVADGDYYLYDESRGLFFSRGGNWGTRFLQDCYGVPVHIGTSGFGTTKVQFLDSQQFLGSDVYTDKASNFNSIAWTMEKKGSGFVLKSSNGSYLKMDDDGALRLSTTSAADAIVITPKGLDEYRQIRADIQRKNIIAALKADGQTIADNATMDEVQAKLDAYVQQPSTAKIKNPKTGSTTNWVHTPSENQQDVWNQYNIGAYGGELYQKTGTISQTVAMPHAGLYKLTLTALYREGQNADCYRLGQQGYELSNAWVSVNDVYQAQVPSWYKYCASSSDPNSTDQAKALMDAGKYPVTVYAYIGEDKKATITLHMAGYVSGGWMLFNNFAFTEYIVEGSGVEEVENGEWTMDNVIYNLAGQRLNRPQKGVNIVGGKKVLVK